MPGSGTATEPLAPIRKFGSSCLRRAAPEAEPGSLAVAELLDRMWQVLSADGGVGLAAPQIGVSRRVVVVRDTRQPLDRQRLDLVNPVITGTFGNGVLFEEGCLSFPGLYFPVRRPKGVRVEYFDRQGQPQRLEDRGLVARIVLHEVDHLDGVLFIDHLPRWRRLLLAPRLLFIQASRLLGKRGCN